MEQRVVLSEEDIDRIVSLGYPLEYFTEVRNGFYYLKNYGGRCVFYDPDSRKCRIYEYRPLTCRLYPIVYEDKKVFIDEVHCPGAKNLEEEDVWNVIPYLIEHVFNLRKGYKKYPITIDKPIKH